MRDIEPGEATWDSTLCFKDINMSSKTANANLVTFISSCPLQIPFQTCAGNHRLSVVSQHNGSEMRNLVSLLLEKLLLKKTAEMCVH